MSQPCRPHGVDVASTPYDLARGGARVTDVRFRGGRCVDGFGPTISPYFRTASFTWSSAAPGWTIAVRPPGSTETTW